MTTRLWPQPILDIITWNTSSRVITSLSSLLSCFSHFLPVTVTSLLSVPPPFYYLFPTNNNKFLDRHLPIHPSSLWWPASYLAHLETNLFRAHMKEMQDISLCAPFVSFMLSRIIHVGSNDRTVLRMNSPLYIESYTPHFMYSWVNRHFTRFHPDYWEWYRRLFKLLIICFYIDLTMRLLTIIWQFYL